MHTVIFDLDGTLSDSAEGIVKSINYALQRLGLKQLPAENLMQYIGPPLNVIIEKLTGSRDEDFLLKGVKLFRERYFSIGYKENVLYEGIAETLKNLTERGDILCVATAKREDIAKNVLAYFGIDKYFTQVQGSDLHRKKSELLRDMMNNSTLNHRPMVMIGDRDSDFRAAGEAGIPSLGVKWGYGNDEELKLATAVVDKPEDLPAAIDKNAKKFIYQKPTP